MKNIDFSPYIRTISSLTSYDRELYYKIKNEIYTKSEDECYFQFSWFNGHTILPTYIVEIIKRIPTYEEFIILAPSISKIYRALNKE
jgi:hypothetical protein